VPITCSYRVNHEDTPVLRLTPLGCGP
jgi:hypothetical protein